MTTHHWHHHVYKTSEISVTSTPYKDRHLTKMLARILALLFALILALSAGFSAHGAERVTYYYTNEQGTPLVTVDGTTGATTNVDYRPYGPQTLGPVQDGPGYTGHVDDVDSGLVYMQARYYDPAVARFASADPAGIQSGDHGAFNRYAYAANNPIGNIDADGRQPVTVEAVPPEAIAEENAVAIGAMEASELIWIDPAVPATMEMRPPSMADLRSTVNANKAAGDAFEKVTLEGLKAIKEVVTQITIVTDSGVKTRVDIVTIDNAENISCIECKSSQTARLTRNQKAAFPEISRSGGRVAGKGKPGLPGGTRIPPVKVQIVRPPPPPPPQTLPQAS